MTVSISNGIGGEPIVQRVPLNLPQPGIDDNTADLDRLMHALKALGYGSLRVHTAGIRELVAGIRRHAYRLQAIIVQWGEFRELLAVEAPGRESPVLGVAADLGTTSLAFYLVDLLDGSILDQLSMRNPQIIHGEDILTRILFSREDKNRKALQGMLMKSFNTALHELTSRLGFASGDVCALSVAGNTAMSHFFLGLDAAHLCMAPYIPSANNFPMVHARDLGIEAHPFAPVYVFPNAGSYFGGDLLAGIIGTGIHRGEDIRMLVDVGTNAEVVLGNKDWLIACAGAAGPAMEGGVMECGMPAEPGAVDRVRIDRSTLEPSLHVIGGGKPRGFCGSGVIELVAEMFASGLLSVQGKINTESGAPHVVQTTDGPAYMPASGAETENGRDLLVTEMEIGVFLKSKAAMYTILQVICNQVGIGLQDIQRIFVAGAFGNHIDPAMAIAIGMLPDLPPKMYEGVGNSAGKGAVMALLDRSVPTVVGDVLNRVTYVELNVNMELMQAFRGALFLPHTDPRLFPSVKIPGNKIEIEREGTG